MNKIILSILTLILIMFSGCSSTSINTNPQTEDGSSQFVTIGNSSKSVDIVTDSENNNFLRVDATTPAQTLVNHFLTRKTGANTTTNTINNVGSRTINVVSTTAFTVGNFLSIDNGTQHLHHYRKLLSKTATTLTFGAPLDFDIANNSLVSEEVFNMNVDGSVTPISYKVEPPSFAEIDITRLIVQFVLTGAPDDSKFGNLGALTNGVVIRKNFNNTRYETIAVWRTNKDIREDMHDLVDVPKAGGGNFALSGRWSFTKLETIISLNEAEGEFMEVLIQDDLTSLIDFQIKLQGHFDEE